MKLGTRGPRWSSWTELTGLQCVLLVLCATGCNQPTAIAGRTTEANASLPGAPAPEAPSANPPEAVLPSAEPDRPAGSPPLATGPASTEKPPHPGTITFEDGIRHEVTQTLKAAEVPEEIRYAQVNDKWIPVVRIVSYETEERRIIREYGPDGSELRSTVQVRTQR